MSSELMKLSTMMESINIANDDDSDFVIVHGDSFETDNASYDYCEDVISLASFTLSLSSDVHPEEDLRDVLLGMPEAEENRFLLAIDTSQKIIHEETLEEESRFREETKQEDGSVIFHGDDQGVSEFDDLLDDDDDPYEAIAERMEMQSSSRRCNKKRRKNDKLTKKAAAMSCAAVTLSRLRTKGTPKTLETTVPPPMRPKSQKKFNRSNKQRIANVAVACATESLATFRMEAQRRQKGKKKKFLDSHGR